MLVRFDGAKKVERDGETVYRPLGNVYVDTNHVSFFYDHTIVADGKTVVVMDDEAEIYRKLELEKLV